MSIFFLLVSCLFNILGIILGLLGMPKYENHLGATIDLPSEKKHRKYGYYLFFCVAPPFLIIGLLLKFVLGM